jgi:riboflavin kinase/FMN adenylyltransferase
MLAAWCSKSSITLDNPTPVLYEGERISSSRIRTAIRDGKLIDASAMLGRPFTILGQVVPGEGRGHGLGFPTANLATEDECIPPDGVYAGRACLADGTFHPAAINLGTGPTFERHQRKIEAHLPGFTGNLSGQEMDLEFHHWIRGEKNFANPTALADQIRLDVATILQSA